MALYIFERSTAYIRPLIFLMIAASGMSRFHVLQNLVTNLPIKLAFLP